MLRQEEKGPAREIQGSSGVDRELELNASVEVAERGLSSAQDDCFAVAWAGEWVRFCESYQIRRLEQAAWAWMLSSKDEGCGRRICQ